MDLLLIIALAPAIYLLNYVYRKDRLEKEPSKLLWKLGGFGALCGIVAGVLEGFGDAFLSMAQLSPVLYYVIEMYLVVGLAEEGCKYLTLKLVTGRSKEFNCSYDGMLYAVYVSLGFAILENIIYVFEYGFINALFRAFTAVPGHCFFGVFMGLFYSRAKSAEFEGDTGRARTLRLAGLGVAILVHGTYDLLLTLAESYDELLIPGYILFLILLAGMYYFGFRSIRLASAEDHFIDPQAKYEHSTDKVWTCPACGKEGITGVVCPYCEWQVPKSGSTAVPVLPEKKPSETESIPMPQRTVKLPLSQRLLPLWGFLVPFVLAYVFMIVLYTHTDDSGIINVCICGMVVMFAFWFIGPIYFAKRNRKQLDALEPDYQTRMNEWREALKQNEAAKTAYTNAEIEMDEYKKAVRRAEKKKAKETASV